MSEKPVRPSHATLSGWLIMAGSLLVVLACFQRLSSLGSIEAQEAAADAIADAPTAELGLSVDDVQLMLRVLCLVAGGLATLSAGLGWLVLQRSRGARVGLSVVGPLLLLVGVATAGFAVVLLLGGIVMLWLQPTRAWLSGAPPPSEPADPPEDRREPVAASAPPPPPARGTMSAMTHNPEPYGAPQYGGGSNPYGGGSNAPVSRPGGVTAAAVITMIFSGLSLLLWGFFTIGILVARDNVIDEIQDEPNFEDLDVTADTLFAICLVIFLVLAIWSLIAFLLGIGVLRGSNAARITLVVSSAVTILASLISILALFPALTLIAAIVVIVLLFTGGAGDWFAAKKAGRA